VITTGRPLSVGSVLIQSRLAEVVFRLTERYKLKRQRLLKTASYKADLNSILTPTVSRGGAFRSEAIA
jgi:hypothetical protein